MKNALVSLGRLVARRRVLWVSFIVGFVLLYQVGLLAVLVTRFGKFPNYVTFYNYPANVYEILVSTPSLQDAVGIIEDEWLIEIGHMNYDYGHGVSEWSLTILPAKLVVLLTMGALVATCIVLLLPDVDGVCAVGRKAPPIAALGGGASLVGLSSATMSWVVCCATPNWAVALTMLGMSSSFSLWLEPYGPLINLFGFVVLIATLIVLARRRLRGTGGGSAYTSPVSSTT